jgi:Cft2 family RNA processing exonuclease
MDLTFLGGADEVGASSTLIRISGKILLVDAGIRISPKTSRGIQNDQLPDLHPISAAGGPDYILVTHAHTDHTGALALVVEQYPHVPVLATRPTIDLTRILQADAQRIMTSKQDAEGELPIFDEIASERLINAFQQVEFRQAIRLGDGLQVTYHPSGHIAGAATLVLEGDEGTLVMSGDVSLGANRAVTSADVPRVKADALVLESTYGGKLHAMRASEERRIIDTLKRVAERGGKVLIPAFALGRAQEVAQIVHAFRDEYDVPVYVDGMARTVCRAYVGFADFLPPGTLKMAGGENLFFRNKVKAVDSNAQREQIINSPEPAVVIASSGMLTGGASVVYAKAWAGDERNAIFLTGYQDEEAPGRFLQRMMKDRAEGKEFTLKMDKESVSVRCEVGTYSLSAHADENELINYTNSFDPDEVMLVHGDPSARHSLATALRQRGRRVHSPVIGQTITFAFARRPWAMGGVESGHESRPLNPAELWEALKGQAGSFFSAREIAKMWWGDAERHAEAAAALANNPFYFSADWRQKDTFQVLTPEQVARKQRQQAIMLANPDIVGKLVVLRDSNNRPKAGIVVNASIDAFEALVYGAKGRHYPADALLWPVGKWEKDQTQEAGTMAQVGEMIKEAKALQDEFLPLSMRQALVTAGQPVNPESLLPETLPEGITRELALLSIVMGLAQDGATAEQGGLLPKRALQDGPVEQNAAREAALAAFPPEARLRKVGMEIHRKRLTLTFDFPARAEAQFAGVIDKLSEQTGWDIQVNPTINQQALGLAISEVLSPGARVSKGPSFFLDKGEVQIEVEGEDDVKALEQRYMDLTGFRLRVGKRGTPPPGTLPINGETIGARSPTGISFGHRVPDEETSPPAPPLARGGESGEGSNGQKLEINAAYAVVRQALEPLGLYKVGLKQGDLALTFISPQVGERHRELIRELSRLTGYGISIHPHPNQQQILQIATQIARECGWTARKGPGIHVDRAEVVFKLSAMPDDEQIAAAQAKFREQTGYALVVEV